MAESIKDKVLKLLKLAKCEGATEAEAAQAMEFASKLIQKHSLDIDESKDEEEPLIGEKIGDGWDKPYHRSCALACGELFTVGSIYYADHGQWKFVGRPTAVQAAELTMPWLIEQVERLYKQALPKGMTKSARAEFRRTFKFACADRVHERAFRIALDMETKDAVAMEATGKTALVVKSKHLALRSEIDDLMSGTRRMKVKGVSQGNGTMAGHSAGNLVQLNKSVQGPTLRLTGK